MKVEIRAWKKADAFSLAAAANNANISNMMRDGFPFRYTKKDADEWILLNEDKEPVTNFAVVVDNQFAGAIGFLQKENIYRKNAEIGYWLGEPFWNKGIATEAVRQLVTYIFSEFQVDRVYAEVFSNNPASMKVLEKNGFHLEAVHKKSIIKNNQVLDDYWWVKFRKGF
jgi:ribosomal-protein-alanine N-acetyltransferase